MVGENLDTGSDNKRHEENVEKVLHPQPRREPGGDGRCGLWNAGVPHEEILHGRKLSHCLGYGYADDGEHKNAR